MLSTDISSLSAVFFTSGLTVGMGHCIGMCGPIVISFALNLKEKNTIMPHLMYNFGRVFTYAVLGGIMGVTGAFTRTASHMMGLQKGVMIFTGVFIIIMGVSMSGWIPANKIFQDNNCLSGFTAKYFKRLSALKSLPGYFLLGLVLGLLPCGPVYTALLAVTRSGMESANTTQSFFTGMILMSAFGAGTIPALLLVGRLADLKWIKYRAIIYKSGAFLMIGTGIWFTINGIQYF